MVTDKTPCACCYDFSLLIRLVVCFFKQKTAYELYQCDWSSDVCSSDLTAAAALGRFELQQCGDCGTVQYPPREACQNCLSTKIFWKPQPGEAELLASTVLRSEEHTSELQAP